MQMGDSYTSQSAIANLSSLLSQTDSQYSQSWFRESNSSGSGSAGGMGVGTMEKSYFDHQGSNISTGHAGHSVDDRQGLRHNTAHSRIGVASSAAGHSFPGGKSQQSSRVYPAAAQSSSRQQQHQPQQQMQQQQQQPLSTRGLGCGVTSAQTFSSSNMSCAIPQQVFASPSKRAVLASELDSSRAASRSARADEDVRVLTRLDEISALCHRNEQALAHVGSSLEELAKGAQEHKSALEILRSETRQALDDQQSQLQRIMDAVQQFFRNSVRVEGLPLSCSPGVGKARAVGEARRVAPSAPQQEETCPRCQRKIHGKGPLTQHIKKCTRGTTARSVKTTKREYVLSDDETF